MNSSDERKREVEALRERISSLSGAVLRISASLDVGPVLRETVDSARALTGARYGAITTIDEAGRPQDFVTSGLTADEQRQLEAWPHAMRFFEHLRDLPGPLRLPDLPGYLRSLGYTGLLALSRTLQAMPMRHRGVHVGDFFLAEKEGGREFTADDEEILVLFASQAANAIANARAHCDERRARADLEALVETSPVGVVVFDAGTGRPASLNREARRLVDGLNAPGRPPEELLEALTCRFSDGREIALAELPMKEVISDAATVRAEEVVLSVPDGRSVTLRVKATPIHAADGAAESMVVTLQDLASLRELERLQAEFLSMVSHELRAPLTSIKGSTATVLRASRVLDPAEVRQFFRIIDAQADHMDGLIGDEPSAVPAPGVDILRVAAHHSRRDQASEPASSLRKTWPRIGNPAGALRAPRADRGRVDRHSWVSLDLRRWGGFWRRGRLRRLRLRRPGPASNAPLQTGDAEPGTPRIRPRTAGRASRPTGPERCWRPAASAAGCERGRDGHGENARIDDGGRFPWPDLSPGCCAQLQHRRRREHRGREHYCQR